MLGFLTTKRTVTDYLRLENLIESASNPFSFTQNFKDTSKEVYYQTFGFNIDLSDTRYEQERHRYTLVEVLADFGGFNDGLFMLAAVFISPVSSMMFNRSITEKTPVAAPISRQKRQVMAGIAEKLEAGNRLELEPTTMEAMNAKIVRLSLSTFKMISIFCC